MTLAKSAGVISAKRPNTVVIALLTQTSIGPSVALDLIGRGLDRLGVAHVDDASERTVLRELGGRPLDALLVARQHDHARAARARMRVAAA